MTEEATVVNNEIDELDSLIATLDSAAEEAIVADSVTDEDLDAVLDEIEMDEAVDVEPKVEAKTAKRKKSSSIVRAKEALTGSEAILAKLGGEEEALKHFALDSSIDTDDSAIKERMNEVLGLVDEKLAKKVGEKAVNMFSYLAGRAKLSNYTVYALNLLVEKGEFSTAELVDAYLGRPYSVFTARSQANQMLQLLPVLQVAVRSGSNLKLNPNSTIIEHYKASSESSE